MARLNVNPTRMEMTRLKQQLKMATRGHKLLKDKLDELMKQFLDIVRENKRLREEAEKALESAYKDFVVAKAIIGEANVSAALMIPQQTVAIKVGQKNIMSVDVPVFDFQKSEGSHDIYPYGFVNTSGELDNAMLSFSAAMDPLLRLAESEKTAQLLAQEIEKTRRRVTALENVMIPNHIETIKYITLKLEENDRSSKTGVIKVKEMVTKKAIEEKKKLDAELELKRQAAQA
ncbi:MAG: V-type ATP synthase subunit D [Bacillota bacterium]